MSRDGSNAANVVKAARRYGLKAKGLSVDLEDVQKLKPPFIVFWNFNHFLVVEGFRKGKVHLSDPAGGRRILTMQEFDMCALLQETVVSFSLQAEDREQKLEASCQGPCPAWGDSNYIRHVVANLLSNAIKYNPPGASIVIGTSFDGNGHLQVTVRDDGPGIPPQDRKRVFDMFFSTRPGGTGLGLFLAKTAIDGMHGSIRIVDTPSGGSCVRITLPLDMRP